MNKIYWSNGHYLYLSYGLRLLGNALRSIPCWQFLSILFGSSDAWPARGLGLKPVPLIIYGTIGNVLGSVFNYFIGSLGKLEWVEKYLHVKEESLIKARRFMGNHGAWIGFFAFLPIIGSAITILLGYTRANKFISILSIFIGKLLRYLILIAGVGLIFN